MPLRMAAIVTSSPDIHASSLPIRQIQDSLHELHRRPARVRPGGRPQQADSDNLRCKMQVLNETQFSVGVVHASMSCTNRDHKQALYVHDVNDNK